MNAVGGNISSNPDSFLRSHTLHLVLYIWFAFCDCLSFDDFTHYWLTKRCLMAVVGEIQNGYYYIIPTLHFYKPFIMEGHGRIRDMIMLLLHYMDHFLKYKSKHL